MDNKDGGKKSHRTKNSVPVPFPDSGRGGDASCSDPTRRSGPPDDPPSTQPSSSYRGGSIFSYAPLASSPFARVPPPPAPRPAPQPLGSLFDRATESRILPPPQGMRPTNTPSRKLPTPPGMRSTDAPSRKLPTPPGMRSTDAPSSNESSFSQQGGFGSSYKLPPIQRPPPPTGPSQYSLPSSGQVPGCGQSGNPPLSDSPYAPIQQQSYQQQVRGSSQQRPTAGYGSQPGGVPAYPSQTPAPTNPGDPNQAPSANTDVAGLSAEGAGQSQRKIELQNFDKAKSYPCNECNRSFTTAQARIMHVRHIHQKEAAALYPCHLCNRSFATVVTRENHLLGTHREGVPELPAPYWSKCEPCDRQFSTKASYEDHRGAIHGEGNTLWACPVKGCEYEPHLVKKITANHIRSWHPESNAGPIEIPRNQAGPGLPPYHQLGSSQRQPTGSYNPQPGTFPNVPSRTPAPTYPGPPNPRPSVNPNPTSSSAGIASQGGFYDCEFCDRNFSRSEDIQEHMRTAHRGMGL